MTDPKAKQDEVIEFFSTWEDKVTREIDKFSFPPKDQVNQVRLGFLLAVVDVIQALRETLEEHGLPD
jgi:hypothetical protein